MSTRIHNPFLDLSLAPLLWETPPPPETPAAALRTVGFCGPSRSGKDTAAKMLEEELARCGIRSERIALAAPIWDIVAGLLGTDYRDSPDKGEPIASLGCSPRDLAVAVGQGVRGCSPEFWLKSWHRAAEAALALDEKLEVFIATDLRTADEIEHFSQTGPVVAMQRPTSALSDVVISSNYSERCSRTIDNLWGLGELRAQVRALANSIAFGPN